MSLEIRAATKHDDQAIHRVTEAAFQDMPFAAGDEADVVDRLRAAGALSLSLVAVIDAQVVGQITFSPAYAPESSGQWFALGPVSVLPEHQRAGVGSALIRQGLDAIGAMGAAGCILTGNPAYYQRFGFELSPANAPDNEPAEYFMLKSLSTAKPQGKFHFHAAFYGDT